jgi:acetylornithine/N-succinyldiaminopimelate aminotransferase
MLSKVYSPFDLKINRAHGVKVFTDEGEYIDTFSGIGVLAFGHTDQQSVDAVKRKAERFSHISNYFLDDDALLLSEMLLKMDGRNGEVFFTNSGTEATEAAIKAVRKMKRGRLVSFEGNFHGRTMGALSITHNRLLRAAFDPLLPDVVFLPKSRSAFENLARQEEIAAVFVETIQGNSGVLELPSDLLDSIASLKKEREFLIVCDEIQSGLCRTGKYFAYQHYGLSPDIVTLGKAIGGGLPLGAAMFFGISPFTVGDHGSTFAPNPVSLAAGRSVVERMNCELLEDVRIKGDYFRRMLESLPWIESTRGKGLMIGASTRDANAVKRLAFDRKLLLNVTGGSVRFLPALNITQEELDEILKRLNFGG